VHQLIADHAHVAKRRPPPNLELARMLVEGMKSHPELKTQAALARKAGVAQSTISRMMRGEVDSQSGNALRVFDALGIQPPAYLRRPTQSAPASLAAAASAQTKDFRQVPLIDLVQAGGYGETVDPYQPGDGREWLVCPVRCGPRTFALKVDGHSMEPRYHDADIIFVDPDVPAAQGSDVVARLDSSNEATFKQLDIESRRRYLRPLNPQFSAIEITEETRIVGAVIGATWSKSR
jgi:SOS-response transcriptional repressor LexA